MDRLTAALTAVSPLRAETALREAQRCKICESSQIRDFDMVDANKICSEIEPYAFGLCGAGVRYVRCSACGFVFTSDFDSWDEATFSRHIYNQDYITIDPEYLVDRPERSAELVAHLLQGFESARILDYGSGTGALTAGLSRRGFADVADHDPLSQPERPMGLFDLVTCVETIEHAPDPVRLLRDMAGLLAPGGAILLQTSLQPPDISRLRGRWWYIAPRNGHISILGAASLREAARRAGLRLHLRAGESILLYHANATGRPSPIFLALTEGRMPEADFDEIAEGDCDAGPDRISPDWFDAAVVAPVEEALRRRPTLMRSALSRLSRAVSPGRSAVACAEKARAVGQWGRAARFYAEALIAEPGSRPLWRGLAEMLDRAHRPSEAALAWRKADP
jgi:SAM-dependent methyltransferase